MKYFLTIIFIACVFNLSAQTNTIQKDLNVGDYIFIKPCKKNAKEILSMDVYTRTTPYNKKKVNEKTGDGLFDEFFSDKSIEAKPLPCIMSGQRYKVASLQEFNVNGQYKRVVLCYTGHHLTIIWIEFDQALMKNEISF
ncbi:MAG: hypothetical protein ACK4K9_10680 [Bacteroidia bacterium]